jgi:hypothetical protein
MNLEQLRMHQPERHLTLVQEFYEQHHRQHRDIAWVARDPR